MQPLSSKICTIQNYIHTKHATYNKNVYLPWSSSAVQMQHLYLKNVFLIKLNDMQGGLKIIYNKSKGRGSTKIQWVSDFKMTKYTQEIRFTSSTIILQEKHKHDFRVNFCLWEVWGFITEYENQSIYTAYDAISQVYKTHSLLQGGKMTLIIS